MLFIELNLSNHRRGTLNVYFNEIIYIYIWNILYVYHHQTYTTQDSIYSWENKWNDTMMRSSIGESNRIESQYQKYDIYVKSVFNILILEIIMIIAYFYSK